MCCLQPSIAAGRWTGRARCWWSSLMALSQYTTADDYANEKTRAHSSSGTRRQSEASTQRRVGQVVLIKVWSAASWNSPNWIQVWTLKLMHRRSMRDGRLGRCCYRLGLNTVVLMCMAYYYAISPLITSIGTHLQFLKYSRAKHQQMRFESMCKDINSAAPSCSCRCKTAYAF